MIDSEKLNVLLNILFFFKVFVDSNGIFNLFFIIFLFIYLILMNRKTVLILRLVHNNLEFIV